MSLFIFSEQSLYLKILCFLFCCCAFLFSGNVELKKKVHTILAYIYMEWRQLPVTWSLQTAKPLFNVFCLVLCCLLVELYWKFTPYLPIYIDIIMEWRQFPCHDHCNSWSIAPLLNEHGGGFENTWMPL